MNTAILDINNLPSIQIGYIDTIHKNYCSNPNCIEGRIFNPYAHAWKECPVCAAVKRHNWMMKTKKFKDVMGDNLNFGLDSPIFNEIVINLQSYIFPSYSVLIDANNMNYSFFNHFVDYINLKASEENQDFRITTKVIDKDFDEDLRNEDNLILVLMKDIDYAEIRYLSKLLLLRSLDFKATLLFTYHNIVEKFFVDILSEDYRLDKVKVVK